MRNVIEIVAGAVMLAVDKAIESRACSWLAAAALAYAGVGIAFGTVDVGDTLAVRVLGAWFALAASHRAAMHAATGKVRVWAAR